MFFTFTARLSSSFIYGSCRCLITRSSLEHVKHAAAAAADDDDDDDDDDDEVLLFITY